MMKKKYLRLSLLLAVALTDIPLYGAAPETVDADTTVTTTTTTTRTTTATTTVKTEKTTDAAQRLWAKADPSIKLGGYVVGKASATDRAGQAAHTNFDLRFVRLYLNGYCFSNFYYRLQMEVNDAPGKDKGPRVLDAFVEWQGLDELRVKLGQFKRPFGFENPYSPLDVGMGAFAQATMKLASIADRNGEHKSSGRDLGVQLQGDVFPAADGHKWLHYQVGLFNGQGINHKDRDNHKDLIGGIYFQPIKNMAIGGFGWNGTYVNEDYKADEAGSQWQSVRRVRWGVGMKYESAWTVRGEYMASVGGVATNAVAARRADAWYATLGVPVVDNLKLYGRWDCLREDKMWAGLHTDYGFTANYKLGKNLIFQLNYTRTYDRTAPSARRYNTADVQVYARF